MAYSIDEHAWAEMYLDGPGWVVVEAGTAGRLAPPDPEPDPKELDSYLAALNDLPPDLIEDTHGTSRRFNFKYLMAIFPALVFGMFAIKAWRQFAPWVAPTRALHRVVYRAVLDLLSEVVVRRNYGETWDDFAQRISADFPEFATLTEAHLRIAFGSSDPPDRAEWLALHQQIVTRIATVYSASRRWRGRLNPLSWVNVG